MLIALSKRGKKQYNIAGGAFYQNESARLWSYTHTHTLNKCYTLYKGERCFLLLLFVLVLNFFFFLFLLLFFTRALLCHCDGERVHVCISFFFFLSLTLSFFVTNELLWWKMHIYCPRVLIKLSQFRTTSRNSQLVIT